MEKISLKQSTVLRVCLEKAQILYQKGVHVHKYLAYPFAKSSVSPIKSKNALLKGRRIKIWEVNSIAMVAGSKFTLQRYLIDSN